MRTFFFIWGCLLLAGCQSEPPQFSLRTVLESDKEFKALHGGYAKTWILHKHFTSGYRIDYDLREEKQYLIINNKGHYEASELKNLGKSGMVQGKVYCNAQKNEIYFWEYGTKTPKSYTIFEINDSTLSFGAKRNFEMATFRPLNINKANN